MRSLELGLPLPDAQVARYAALGWIGFGVPIAALVASCAATYWLAHFQEGRDLVWALVAIWISCGAICVVALLATIQLLRESPAFTRSAVVDEPRVSKEAFATSLGSVPDRIAQAEALFEKPPERRAP
jgi:MFS family permease